MATDYEALAKQFGGSVAPARKSDVDYEALAKEYGGSIEPKNRANVAAEASPPAWAKEYPTAYKGLVKARQLAGPTLEAAGGIAGGIIGAGAGALASPTIVVNPVTGGVAGSALGYGIAKEGLEAADVALGLKAPRQGNARISEPLSNLQTGAMYEAGGQIIGPYVGKALGKVMDLGSLTKQKAAQIARESFESPATVAAARAEFANAPRNALPSQVLGRVDDVNALVARPAVNAPAAQTLLNRQLERSPAFNNYEIAQRELARLTNLADVSKGATQTEARMARDALKTQINETLIPDLEKVMNRAGLVNRVIPRLEQTKAQALEGAAGAVEDVRRFQAAIPRAEALATAKTAETGLSGSKLYNYPAELAVKADEVATQAAKGSLDFGEAARFSDAALKGFQARGVEPVKTDAIISQINNKLKDPKIGPNKEVSTALKQFGDDVVEWTNANGVMDPWALETIRKNLNTRIATLYPNVDVSTQRKLAAKVMGEVRPLIIDVMEKAGGKGYSKYLADYTKEMQGMAADKLGAEAMKLYKQSPAQFVEFVRGNSDDVVESVMGPGNYNLAEQLSEGAFDKLTKTAQSALSERLIKDQSDEGAQALMDIYKKHLAVSYRLPDIFNIFATTANRGITEIEKRVGAKTLNTLKEAAKRVDTFDDLLATLPATQRETVAKALADPKIWKGGAFKLKAAAETPKAAINALAPQEQSENKNALAR
jgi:hypothetical protein